MLRRNILYTGITRAIKEVIIVGSKAATAQAIHNNNTAKKKYKICFPPAAADEGNAAGAAQERIRNMMDKIIGISILIQCIYARLDITRRDG